MPFGPEESENFENSMLDWLALDVGDQDGLRTDTAKLHDMLDNYGIANNFEIYPGTHTSNVAFRFQDYVLPFFSKTLSFSAQ